MLKPGRCRGVSSFVLGTSDDVVFLRTRRHFGGNPHSLSWWPSLIHTLRFDNHCSVYTTLWVTVTRSISRWRSLIHTLPFDNHCSAYTILWVTLTRSISWWPSLIHTLPFDNHCSVYTVLWVTLTRSLSWWPSLIHTLCASIITVLFTQYYGWPSLARSADGLHSLTRSALR